jgi:hypothetical protein
MNIKMIPYKSLFLAISFLLIVSSTGPVLAIDSQSESSPFQKKTFLMGTIINPVEEDGMWTAQALQVVFYEPEILFDHGGIVKRLTTITFSDGYFIQVWSPGPFGLIAYVFGITSDFEIIT